MVLIIKFLNIGLPNVLNDQAQDIQGQHDKTYCLERQKCNFIHVLFDKTESTLETAIFS